MLSFVLNLRHVLILILMAKQFAGVEARAVVEPSRDIESLRGRLSAFEPRSRRGRRRVEPVETSRGCLGHC